MSKEDIIIIPLTQGKIALIDADDYHLVAGYKWTAKKSAYNWYAVRKETINGKSKRIYMHRVISQCPVDKIVHHLNCNSLDNRYLNLENCSRQDNLSYRRTGNIVL